MLRALRRRHARLTGSAALTYREVAAATGWSHGIVGEYLSGRVLPPTDRFDVLIRLFGATPAEQGALATARDRVEEGRRRPSGGVPRQLPADVYAFTGRHTEMATLSQRLAEQRSTVVVSAVAGTAGVGKTALAVRWAHQVADRFPDGQLYVDLRGYGPEPPVAPADALAGFLRSLGVDAQQIPADPAERAARYRTAVADRRLLVVLDNASSADQVRPLLPGTAGCFVVVTSRDPLASLVAREGAYRIDLDVLSGADAVALLGELVGPRVVAEPDAAADLADRCARLPLALRIVAELATARPTTTIAALRDDLSLDLLDSRTAVRSVFAWSYTSLRAETASAFTLLSLHPGPDFDGYAVAALRSTTMDEAHRILEELARAHLIQPTSPGLFGFHDLLRAYAAELVTEPEAIVRLLDYFVAASGSAVRVLHPHDFVPPSSFAGELPPFDSAAAAAWLDRQRPNLVAVALYAAAHGFTGHCGQLSRTLWRYFEVGGHYQEALAVHSAAAPFSPHALANLGGIHWWLGDHEQARDCLERSLSGHRRSGDTAGESRAAARLGLVYERLGRYADAETQMAGALDLCRRGGDRHGEAGQLLNLGTVHRRLGGYSAAAAHYQRAVDIFASLGERRLEGYACGNLGAVLNLLGRPDEALAQLDKALCHCRDAGDRGGEGSALAAIGAVHARLGRYQSAVDHLHRALDISRETGDRSLETETLNTLGETRSAYGRPDLALAHHRAALAITDRTGDRFEHARALDGIAGALGSDAHREQARAIYAALGVPAP